MPKHNWWMCDGCGIVAISKEINVYWKSMLCCKNGWYMLRLEVIAKLIQYKQLKAKYSQTWQDYFWYKN